MTLTLDPQEDLSVDALIRSLASSKLDASSSSSRANVIQKATQLLGAAVEARQQLAGLSDVKCCSTHAFKRITALYCASLESCTEEETDTLSGLCHGLCGVLAQANAARSRIFTETCRQRLIEATKSKPEQQRNLSQAFFHVASTAPSPTCAPAISLGSTTSSGDEDATSTRRDEWLQLFLEKTLQSSTFASASEVASMEVFLKSITQAEWDDTLASVLSLKLKANPERAFETVQAILNGLKNAEYLSSVSNQLDGGSQLLGTVLKQLKSPKEHIRSMARDTTICLAALGASSSSSSSKDQGLSKVVDALGKALTSVAALPQPDHRLGAYAALKKIATEIPASIAINLDTSVISFVLTNLCTALAKEHKSATAARQDGLEAILQWMVVYKRHGVGTDSKGYDSALTMLRAPTAKNNAADCVFYLGTLVVLVNQDVMESIVMDLFKDAKFSTGLQSVIDASIQKHSATTSIPLVEGLVAVYLFLVRAFALSGCPVLKQPTVAKVLSAGSLKLSKTSFVFSKTMTDVVPSNPIVGQVLPRTIALYTKLLAKQEGEEQTPALLGMLGETNAVTSATRALAACIAHPPTGLDKNNAQPSPTASILSSVQTVLTYETNAADALLDALVSRVNEVSLQTEDLESSLNETRAARENFKPVDESSLTKLPVKGQCSPTAAHVGMDPNAIRRVANRLAPHAKSSQGVAKAFVLMHVGTTLKSLGQQRSALIASTLVILRDVAMLMGDQNNVFASTLADVVSQYACCAGGNVDESSFVVSVTLHKSALSFITSFGSIASNFDPEFDDQDDDDLKPFMFARNFCTVELSSRLDSNLKKSLKEVESLSGKDLDLYRSPRGIPYRREDEGNAIEVSSTDKAQNAEKRRIGGKSRRKGDMGSGFEDEEWERQMKKEMADKKKKAGDVAMSGILPTRAALTSEDKKLVEEQAHERQRMEGILNGNYSRTLSAIQCLSLSDIEVGNSCLPFLYENVTASVTSKCKALDALVGLRDKSVKTLETLATCVYEIDEVHAPTLARAVVISSRKVEKAPADPATDGQSTALFAALPSPCAPAACAIYEMDEFNDTLSGPSFVFLFSVLRAALTGPRTAPGCEAALSVLHRHTNMLFGEGADEIVKPLRKDMGIAVLEILSHDRSQTFANPSPNEVLIECYTADKPEKGPALSTAEIASLLDERGALGNKNCRVGAMIALGSIAQDHQKLIKFNPLIENRIWMNSFDENESIRNAARKTWRTANGLDEDPEDASLSAPSLMYAIPLFPLFSSSDKSIANAAADAFGCAMGMHPKSMEKNVSKLCRAYIEAYPVAASEGKAKPMMPQPISTKPTRPASKKTIKISTGLPKKKTVKKSALAVAGIGAPKAGVRKKKLISNPALLAPKKERTLDDDDLAKQFLSQAKVSDVEAVQDTPEKIAIRLGVLKGISALADSSTKVEFDTSTLKLSAGFLSAYGLADSDDSVQGAARNSLRDIIASNGASDEAIAFLIPYLEGVLSTGKADEEFLGDLPVERVPRDVKAGDRRREGAVVALGSVALHLKGAENAGKIDDTMDMLLGALETPSEGVQSSVAACLTKLMKKGNTQARIQEIVSGLMQDCLHGDALATRRGAAYGISAAVKGSGIASLKKYGVVKRLEEACETGSAGSKEGALFAIELLSERLGLLFEPYVIVLLPSLLKTFSDNSDHVRTAASNAAGLIMSKLSAHGVKLVMPAVLKAFEDPSWRTKQASITMLGSMSHCAPKQLASALPKVVPRLTEAFSDTHPKVKASAEEALGEISKVIKNPEVSEIAPVLLEALTDPAEGTTKGLEALIETEFLHAIDSPSLAIIVPVLHRGLRDRAAKTKRYGALISGNICSMIDDPRDFVPYLPVLLPDLQAALLDPIPDVRSTAAKALGSLTRGLGEETLPDLRPWLIETLRSDSISSAERSGAGQGLTEVLCSCGASIVEQVMHDEILPLRSHPQASTREGVLWVLTFLPSALGQSFTPLIDSSLPALLGGLSDDQEQVRDVAMRAGRVLIRSHGKAHIDKILPSLEEGLNNEDYRIRVASLTLLGDLLSMIGGTSVIKGDGDTQDELRKAEKAQAQIALALGNETRKRVLSGLYLARCDTASAVRQSAVQVWKTVVSVTARALRDILQVLVGKVVEALASGDPERTQVAGRCLGDITSKLGESVLPAIIPVLRNALYSGDKHTRTGVCVGLSEVISGSTKENIMRFIEIIVKVVQDALCDDDDGVRQMAASCFKSLHTVVGNRALDEIVPSLLVAIEDDDDENRQSRALNGITGILSIRSRELLPYIIPRLIQSPVTKSHANALAGIAAVTGDTIHMHFNTIIPTLITDLADFFGVEAEGKEIEREEAVRNCARAMAGFVDEGGVNWLIGEIARKCGSDKEAMRKEGCWMMQVVVEERKEDQDFYEQIPIILRELIHRFNDESSKVITAANLAFKALSTHVPAEELVDHIEFIRNLIASMVSEARRRKGGVGDGEFFLPGFNIKKGLEPLLPIYQRGILYGNATIREVSAAGLGELIELTDSKFLAGPLIIKMTGPLLRIVGDRNPSAVKIAILRTLGLVLTKGGPALRAFVPQFQTTFVKALSDPSRQVRVEAIGALAMLMPLSTRVDPLMKELVTASLGKSAGGTSDTAGVAAVQTATLLALATVLKNGGKKAKLPDSIPSALEASKELVFHEDEGVRDAAARVMGVACELLGGDVANDVVDCQILSVHEEDSSDIRHGKACASRRIMASSIGPELSDTISDGMTKLMLKYMQDDKSSVKEAACVAIGAVVGSNSDPKACLNEVEPIILRMLTHKEELSEVHQALAVGLCLSLQVSGAEGVALLGKPILDACVQKAMGGAQRVHHTFNDVLWLALDVANGEDGLEAYIEIANFDNAKAIKSLHAKILTRIKQVNHNDY